MVFVAVLREINCVRFGRIASLSAFVLFVGGCVVRIVYESFLDFGFSEFFMLLEWRTAVHFVSLRFQYRLIKISVKGDSLPSILEDALPFCPFGTFPHTVGNHPPRRAEPARPQFAYGEKTVSGLHGFAFLFSLFALYFYIPVILIAVPEKQDSTSSKSASHGQQIPPAFLLPEQNKWH